MTSAETDISLLHRFAGSRDPAAFAEIIRRYAGMVFATCHRVLHDAAGAQDVSQETFFRLMRRPEAVSTSLGAWLHTAATNLAVDSLRSESARARREQEYARERALEAEAQPSAWATLSPQIDQALAELPEELRGVLIAHFLQGRPQNELATEAKTSAATMSRRIRAAVEALQQKLRGQGVTIVPLALIGLLHDHALQAIPASLGAELGKMAMVSGGLTASVAPPSVVWVAMLILTISAAIGAIGAWVQTHFYSVDHGKSPAASVEP